jgi:outer membrane protein assembly factor BamE
MPVAQADDAAHAAGVARGGWIQAAAVAAVVLALTGCAGRGVSTDAFLGLVTPYRIDIVQGNVITREAVAALRPGMTRTQVSDILGSPMLTDPFHRDRWDYLFTIRRPGTPAQRYSVVVRFDGDRMRAVEAPADLPTENQFVASIVPPARRGGPAPALELTPAQLQALPAPRATEPTAAAPTGPTRSYPPLERP